MRLLRRRKRLNLALQGGGAHGAFTWGVLDRLLEEDDITLSWISGTSAGAVNAAAVASGLATGGRAAARGTLRTVWDGVEQAGVPDLLRFVPFFFGLTRGSDMTPLLSPYEFNPLGFDPLRRVLTTAIDFEKLRASPAVELLIAATDIATGRAHLFRRHELIVEMVLASACLPTLHHSVQIAGRAYWDGGFSANPDLVTLAAESPVGDTLIVQLNAPEKQAPPRTAGDIAAQVNTITFNQPLLRDVELIVEARNADPGWRSNGHGRLAHLRRHRFHLIEAGRYTASLSADSKVKPDRGVLTYLYTSGRAEMTRWLEQHRRDIGRRETVDLKQRFLDVKARRDALAANADVQGDTAVAV